MGISFSIWNIKRNADGSESQVKEFTCLLGSQKKNLLNGLPSKLGEVLCPDTCETVKQIWTDFECLYNKISDFNLSKTAANAIFVQAKAWVQLFCSLKGIRPRYTRSRVTPYMLNLTFNGYEIYTKHEDSTLMNLIDTFSVYTLGSSTTLSPNFT